MLTKEEVLKTVNDLPGEFSFEDILDRLMLLNKIDIGLEQSNKGEIVSTKEAEESLAKWLK
jgi:predicted transcriptional regulator